MRVLFIPFPRPSHLFFMVPLAWAFRAAGHDVRVAAQPALTPAITSAGLAAVELADGPGPGGARDGKRRITPRSLAKAPTDEFRKMLDLRFGPLVELARAMAPELASFSNRWRPQLVVTDPLILAAPIASAPLGTPLLRHLTGPDVMHRTSNPMRGTLTGDEFSPHWPTGLAELFEEFGVSVHNDHAVGSIDPWPGSLQVPDVNAPIPMRFVPYGGSTTPAPRWIARRSERPRVCLAREEQGTPDTTFSRILGALESCAVEVVLTGGATGDLPDNVRVADDVPAHLLLPTCDAVVSPGGTNMILTAAALGVPQVLLPQTAETPANAANFCASGAGVTLDADEATADSIASAVTAALTDEKMRASARRVRAEIDGTQPPAGLVARLADLI